MELISVDMSQNSEHLALIGAVDWSEFCECDGIDENPKFYDNHQHKNCITKHHYHCSMCGKVSQIG